jgi:hypothetical protein
MEENRAERAGRAAKTALRRRRERKRVVGWAAATLLGIPLLFAAVWCRLEVSRALSQRDELLARKELLEHSVLRLSGEKTRLVTWASLSVRAGQLGLRAPRSSEVLWIDRDGKGRRRR